MNSVSQTNGRVPHGQTGAIFASIFTFFLIFNAFSDTLKAQNVQFNVSESTSELLSEDVWADLSGGIPGSDVIINAMVQHNQYIYVGGQFEISIDIPVHNIARYNLDSSRWETVGTGGTDDGFGSMVNTIEVHNDLIYVGGTFTQINGFDYPYLAAYNPRTFTWESTGTELSSTINAIFDLHSFGDLLYVGGDFTRINASNLSNIASFEKDGGTIYWSPVGPYSFSDPTFLDGPVLAIDGDETELAFGGIFRNSGDQTVNGLVRYIPGTQTWIPMGSGVGAFGIVSDIEYGDGYIYVSGAESTTFVRVGSYFITDGSDDVNWASIGDNLNGNVFDLEYRNFELFAAGDFTEVDGQASAGVARYNTVFWEPFGTGVADETGMGGGITLAFAEDKLIVGGRFTDAGGVAVNNVARWSADFGSGGDGGDGDLPDIALTAPTDNAQEVSIIEPVTFSWTAPSGVTVEYYILEIFTNDNPDFPFFTNSSIDPILGTSFDYVQDLFGNLPLSPTTDYTWQVKGYNDSDQLIAQTTTRFSFTTEGPEAEPELAVPTLIAPTDGATGVSLTPTFTWSKDALATGYVLEYSEGATLSESPSFAFLPIAQLTDEDPNYSYTLPVEDVLTSNTQYSWRVTVAGEDPLEPKTSSEASFTTVALPQAFDLIGPVSETPDVTTLPTLTWEQSENATSYVVQVSESNDFDGTLVVDSDPLGRGESGFSVSYTITEADRLGVLKTYYWRVIASSEDGSVTSATESFTTIFDREITLISPDDGAEFTSVGEASATDFTWDDVFEDATSFNYFPQIFLDDIYAVSPSNYSVTDGIVTINELNSFTLGSGLTYSWFVEGSGNYVNKFTETIRSGTRTFTIAPQELSITSPEINASLSSETSFSWGKERALYSHSTEGNRIYGNFEIQLLFENDETSDPLTNPADGYSFLLAETNDIDLMVESFTLEEIIATNSDIASVEDFLSDNAGKTLYWRVRIHPEYEELDQDRVTLWSDLRAVQVPVFPLAFDLLTPTPNATDISATPTFTWEQSENATSYELEISTSSNFETPLFTSESIARGSDDEVSYTLATDDRILFGETYFWRVKAINENGEVISGPTSFTTSDEGTIITNPLDGKVFASLQDYTEEIFTWETKANADFDDITSAVYVSDRDPRTSDELHTGTLRIGRGINNYQNSTSYLITHGFTYFWIVNASYNDNSNSRSLNSELASFTIAPEKPEINLSEDLVVSGPDALFEWSSEERSLMAVDSYSTSYPGKFIVQILFDESTNVETLTADQGFQFEVAGTEELEESFTLAQLFAGLPESDTRTVQDLFSRGGETLYWRVKIKPTYEPVENRLTPPDRETVWSDLGSFEVQAPPQVSDITLLGPGTSDSDVPENVSLRPTFSWEALTDLENVYYILEVSQDAEFSTLFESATTQQTSSMIDVDLDGPATYYWRVKAIIGQSGSDIVGQSVTRSFRTNTQIELVSLEDESENVNLESVFEWYSNKFNFIVTITEPGVGKSLVTNATSSKRFTLGEIIENRVQLEDQNLLSTLDPGKQYQWSISVFDERFNFLGTSETRTFTTSPALGVEPPVLGDVEILSERRVTLNWSADANGSYLVEIAKKTSNQETIEWTSLDIVIGLTATVSGLEPATTYLWRVTSLSSTGDQLATSEIGEFATSKAPDVITVTSPTQNNIPLTGVTYRWEPDPNATKYQVLVFESDDLNTPIIDEMVDAVSGGGIQSYTATDEQDLSYSTNYRWRVIGYNGTKRGELNEYATFRTQSIIPGGGVAATKLSLIEGYPVRASSGQVIERPFVVAVVDASGLLVESSNAEIQVSISPASAPLNGTLKVRAVNGIATFSDLVLTKPTAATSATYKLMFSAGGLTSISSPDIVVTAPGSDKLVASNFSATVTTGETIKNQPIISLTDAAGNVLTDKTDEVTVSISQGATLLGATRIRAIAGKATFTDLGLQGAAGIYTMTFSASGYVSVSKSVSVTASQTVISFQSIEGVTSSEYDADDKAELLASLCDALDLDAVQCQKIRTASAISKNIGNTENSQISNTVGGLIPVFWNSPQDSLFDITPIVHYPIEFRVKGSENWDILSRLQSADTVTVLTGLKLDTTYELRIAFSTENVTSDFSDPIEFETIDLQTLLDFIEEVANEIIATSIETEEMPTDFALFQNYPNPFNPTSTIRFALPEPSEVQLEVYSILGQRIAVLSTGLKPAGYHSVQLDASRWASGTYIYRLRAGDRVFTKKLLLLK